MEEKTRIEYRKLAEHFYSKHGLSKPTASTVINALCKCAAEYRPAYWRRLRSALAMVAHEQGYFKAADKIRAAVNPITSDKKRHSEIKRKQSRQKAVSADDEQSLLSYLFEQKERTVFAAVTLVSQLGCRPTELKTLVFMEGESIFIPSGKKTADGKRGLDRIIQIKDASLFNSLRQCHEMLIEAPYSDPVRYAQKRLATLTQRLWPRRKVRPSLYSWRHQFGSDLKASRVDPHEIAALMGHRSIDSVSVYGDRRNSQSTRDCIKPERAAVKEVQQANQHRLLKKQHKSDTLDKLAITRREKTLRSSSRQHLRS